MNDDRFDDEPAAVERPRAPNPPTVCLSSVDPNAPPPASFEQLFVEHYGAIRHVCETTRRRGVALFVVHERRLVAAGTLMAKPFDINTAVLGRHGVVDVFVDGDAALSLRHALVILHPCHGNEELRCRVIDLRSGAGFVDEQGRSLESVETEGPIFLRCSAQSVMLIPTEPDPIPWPDDPHDGWQCVPERVHLQEIPPPPFPGRGRIAWDAAEAAGRPRPSMRQSFIWFFGGPSFAALSLVGPDEPQVAELLVHGPAEVSRMPIGRAALGRGILLGRYERCDGHGLPALDDEAISRVHVLIVEVRGTPYAIDLASINGLWCGDQRIRSTPLDSGQALKLADGRVWFEWRATK